MRTSAAGLGLALLLAGACRSPTDTANGRDCPQTYEFGNYGCARLVLVVQAPPEPLPAGHVWNVGALPARTGTGVEWAPVDRHGSGTHTLEITRYWPPDAGSGDTASLWIYARVHVPPTPVQVNVPFPVFAADSALRVVRFAPVGRRPRVDTVRLTLRRSDSAAGGGPAGHERPGPALPRG